VSDLDTLETTDVRIDQRTVARLHGTSGAIGWGVSAEAFGDVLRASVAHRFPTTPSPADLDVYLASLHASDLALACACRAGHDGAWEHFIRELRPALYASARTIAGDAGRELADSLYAELFGLPGADGERRSLLAYYHGRSRLITWLRSVMVQRFIDRGRANARFEPLGDDEPLDVPSSSSAATDPERQRLSGLAQQALDAAIDGLEPKDRLRLRLYYGQDLTLARIGRLLGESEATVSRKLERARRTLRGEVSSILRRQHGLSAAAVQLCFEYAAEAPEMQLDRLLGRGSLGEGGLAGAGDG
jgi:RNA polymerase sigma-70 factor, ECF subfamily